MRKFVVFFTLIVLFTAIGTGWTEETDGKKTVGVLPFAVNSSENLEYVKNGIWDMLISRLSAGENISVTDKPTISNASAKLEKKEFIAADAYQIGKKLGIDYVVWGSITKIGNSISLDGKLLDISTYKTPVSIFEQCKGMDDVIPKINQFAQKISYFIVNKELPASSLPEPLQKEEVSQAKDSGTDIEGGPEPIEALKTKEGTYTSIINPSFITKAGVLDRKGFFTSPRYNRTFKGMDIGDTDGDNKNEVVLIDAANIFIYQKNEGEFSLRNKISGKSYEQFLAVDVADINGNGVDEILVTNWVTDVLRSFVVEFKDGKYQRIASNLPWFLRVVTTSDGTQLLGQQVGLARPFTNPIYEIRWKGGSYKEGERMPIPEGLSVYGLTIASLDGGKTERVIALDEYDHLCVYAKTKKQISQIHLLGGSNDLLWKSDDIYGGTKNRFDYVMKNIGLSNKGEDLNENSYVNIRILTYDITGNGKQEVIIVKNLSPIGRLFQNVRVFTSSEIYDLEWDGMGLLQNWQTRKIHGYVADYQFKDIDNDGQNEVVLAINLESRTSVVVAYDLVIQ
ncbi:MAG: FG-GAP-like repeat-containing protein [Syntrophales bacterium]|jgi:TolB-like protein|nr:FG-GAP-like repeat-containing protein [Syntrophales bacterium]MDY0043258.1 FG-GAP-like repeat-containing protein [Syntrophales bacterium]